MRRLLRVRSGTGLLMRQGTAADTLHRREVMRSLASWTLTTTVPEDGSSSASRKAAVVAAGAEAAVEASQLDAWVAQCENLEPSCMLYTLLHCLPSWPVGDTCACNAAAARSFFTYAQKIARIASVTAPTNPSATAV